MNAGTEPRAGRREWIGLGVIALPCLLYSMDLTVLELAVPKLSADLKPTSSQLLWIMDIYGFLLAGLLITMGTLGDNPVRCRVSVGAELLPDAYHLLGRVRLQRPREVPRAHHPQRASQLPRRLVAC